jgi:hypothetical protein
MALAEFTINWRPVFDPAVAHRELEIIKDASHCNAVKICGYDINRLIVASEDALKLGLEVWLSPEMWDKTNSKHLITSQKPPRQRNISASYFLKNRFLVLVRR